MTTVKARWRRRLLAARRARGADDLRAARQSLTDHLTRALTAAAVTSGSRLTVCAYLPFPTEPLDPKLPNLLACSGCRVLVPVVTGAGAPLDWCELPPEFATVTSEYDASLVPGPFGILEPSGPRLGSGAIRQADAVLVPALATDPGGFRLGRGGGFYDRTLALLPPQTVARERGRDFPEDDVILAGGLPALIAVIFDDEAGLSIPREAHDAPVTHVATPVAGVRRIA